MSLPVAPKFVARLPVANVIGFGVAIGGSARTLRGSRRTIAILDPLGRFLGCAGAGIDTDHRLATHRAAKGDELVRSERVGFHSTPGVIRQRGTLLHRSHAVTPMIRAHEVAARPAKQRQSGLLEPLHDVGIGAANVVGWAQKQVSDHYLSRRLA